MQTESILPSGRGLHIVRIYSVSFIQIYNEPHNSITGRIRLRIGVDNKIGSTFRLHTLLYTVYMPIIITQNWRAKAIKFIFIFQRKTQLKHVVVDIYLHVRVQCNLSERVVIICTNALNWNSIITTIFSDN